jgi:hypothetical protein
MSKAGSTSGFVTNDPYAGLETTRNGMNGRERLRTLFLRKPEAADDLEFRIFCVVNTTFRSCDEVRQMSDEDASTYGKLTK